LINKLQSN